MRDRDVGAAAARALAAEDEAAVAELGVLELSCQTLIDPGGSQSLLVYTATPGSESHDKLRLLALAVAALRHKDAD